MAKEVWVDCADSTAACSLDAYAQSIIFPVGKPNDTYAKYFIGQSYLAPVVTEGIPISNVTFEPGCRNNWHIHKATKGGGQILAWVAEVIIRNGEKNRWNFSPAMRFISRPV